MSLATRSKPLIAEATCSRSGRIDGGLVGLLHATSRARQGAGAERTRIKFRSQQIGIATRHGGFRAAEGPHRLKASPHDWLSPRLTLTATPRPLSRRAVLSS